MSPKNKLLTSLLAGAAILSSQASAVVLFSDDFSGSGSGTGWAASSTWNDNVVHSNGTGSVSVSGGSIVVANNGTNNTNTRTHRALASSVDVTVSSDLWFSANIDYTGVEDEAAWFGVSFFENFSAPSTGDNTLFVGANTATDFWQILSAPGDDTSTINHFTTNTAFMLVNIQDDKVEMWINPVDTSSAGSLGTASASVTGSYLGDSYDAIRIGAGNNNTSGNDISSVTIDSMILSTTFAEAVPEPSTGLFIAFAASAFFLRRRRA